jgi:hypothetical protein
VLQFSRFSLIVDLKKNYALAGLTDLDKFLTFFQAKFGLFQEKIQKTQNFNMHYAVS